MVYSDSDFERLYLRYMAEGMPRGESIQAFCSRHKVPYNLFDNYEVIDEYRLNLTPMSQLVHGHPTQDRAGADYRQATFRAYGASVRADASWRVRESRSSDHGGHKNDEWSAGAAAQFELPGSGESGGESGGTMLNITGVNRFWYLRDFHDMRCKYDRVRSVIRQQLNREPREGDVFIMMSKNRRVVRLFSYDSRSCSMHEKRFQRGYSFMKVERVGEERVFSVAWSDVLLLMESPVIKSLKIN